MRQNIAIALATVILLLAGIFLGEVSMAIGMLAHEASVLVVIANADAAAAAREAGWSASRFGRRGSAGTTSRARGGGLTVPGRAGGGRLDPGSEAWHTSFTVPRRNHARLVGPTTCA